MNILAIDPGIENLGYALLEVKDSRLYLKDWNILNTQSFSELPEKLTFLFQKLQDLIKLNKPKIIVIETAFIKKFPLSGSGLLYSQSIVFLLAGLFKIPIKSYSPSEIKKNLTQNGKARKRELFNFIKLLFENQVIVFRNSQSEKDFWNENYSSLISHKLDALALALTYILENKII